MNDSLAVIVLFVITVQFWALSVMAGGALLISLIKDIIKK